MDEEKILFNLPELAIKIRFKSASKKTKLRGIHLHKAVEVVKVLSGEITCTADNKSFTVLENQIVIFNSKTVHQIAPKTDKADFIYIQIDIDKYYDTLFSNEHKKIVSFLRRDRFKNYDIFENKGVISTVFDGLEHELHRENTAYEPYVKAYIYMLVAFMCRKGMLYDFEWGANKSYEKILPIVEYVENNLSYKISLDNLSQHLNSDKYNICKLFKAISGETLTDYINGRRISHSQELLLNSNKSIAEIATECGFNSQQYFNLVFKEKISMSPSDFRKLKKEI